jgi:hypothetical protein
LFGIAIARVVGLTVDHISQRDSATYLTVDQHPVLIPPAWRRSCIRPRKCRLGLR